MRTLVATLLLFVPSFGSADPDKSLRALDGYWEVQISPGDQEIVFTVAARKGFALNLKAPWSLKIDSMSSKCSGTRGFESERPGFSVAACQNTAFDYEIVGFSCTKDKKHCYRTKLRGHYP